MAYREVSLQAAAQSPSLKGRLVLNSLNPMYVSASLQSSGALMAEVERGPSMELKT